MPAGSALDLAPFGSWVRGEDPRLAPEVLGRSHETPGPCLENAHSFAVERLLH